MPYDKEKLQNILLQSDCRTLDKNGKILPPSHQTFIRIANRMALCGSHIEPRHIYTIVNEDRNGFRTLVAKTFLDTMEAKAIDISDFSVDTHLSDESHIASDTHLAKKIKLVLSPQNWQAIAPKKKISSGRVYWKFQEGWADIIAEKVCLQHKAIDCVFAFKNNVTNPTATAANYSTFNGYCTECKAQINGRLEKAPMKDVDVIFSCRIDCIQPDKHTATKGRQLRGKRREKIAAQMIHHKKSAVVIRREMATKYKDFGGKMPSIIPKNNVLRKAKEQRLLKMYGLEFALRPLNLLKESTVGHYAGVIHNIGLLKFHCIYWTPEQEQIYTARCKNNPNAIMTIDATGSIAKSDHKDDPHIFLYQCMIVTNEGSVPVFQMVTGDQRSFQIANFLRIILSKRLPRPPIVVCDFGRALVNAVAEILGSCSSLADYLERCYSAIKQIPTNIPTTYIRLDVSHISAMVSRWSCVKSTSNAGRQLYLRCIAQAYQMSDFKKVAYFLESVLIVCLSEFIGNGKDGLPLQSEIRMQILDKAIEGDDSDFSELKDDAEPRITDEDNKEVLSEDACTDSMNWKQWADDLYNSAERIAKTCMGGNRPNGCYNPTFALRLSKQLLPFIPLWTGIMRSHFGIGSKIATSSSVEAEFNDLKNRSFANQLPMRIDMFVLEHLNHLDGKIKLASNPSDVAIPNYVDTSINNDQSLNCHTKYNRLSLKDSSVEYNDNSIIHSSVLSDFHTQNFETLPVCDQQMLGSNGGLASIEVNGKNSTDSQSNLMLEIDYGHKIDQGHINDNEEQTNETNISEIFEDENILSSTLDECDNWNVCENWRGKAAKESSTELKEYENKVKPDPKPHSLKRPGSSICLAAKRRKPTKLDKCPEWKYIKNVKFCKLPCFKNGNLCSPVNMGKYMLNVKNTCAFDSIWHVILSAMTSNAMYLEKLKNTSNRTILFARSLLHDKHRLMMASYKERAGILSTLSMFQIEQFTRTIKRLDTNCNVAHLAQYLFVDVPSLKTRIACSCGYRLETENVALSINIDILLCEGFSFLQKAIDEGRTSKRLCRKCHSIINEEVEYGPHIILDTTVITDENYKVRNEGLTYTLQSVAETVQINNKIYRLAGLVHYIPGHYVAYVKLGLYWYMYDDLAKGRQSVQPSTEVKPHLMVYTQASY